MSTLATGQGHELKFAVIAASSSGDNTIVAADAAGRKIKVVSYALLASAAVTTKFKSGAATDITGGFALAANGGVSCPGAPSAHLFETAANTALVLNLSGAIAVGGHVSYMTEA